MTTARQRRRDLVDADTGEVFDLVAVPRAQRVQSNPGGGWLMAMQQGLGALATDPTLTDGDLRVLTLLLSRLDWQNFLHLEVSGLARDLDRSREAVSRSVSRLVARGVLHRGPRVGRAYTYRLDPAYGYKGRPEGRAALAAEIEKRGWEVVNGGSDEGVEGQETLPLDS